MKEEMLNSCNKEDFGFGQIEISSFREVSLSSDKFEEYYVNEDYENYIIEYLGNVVEGFSKIDYAAVAVTNPLFGVAAVRKGMASSIMKDVPEVTYIQKSYPYTLTQLDKITSVDNYKFISEESLELNGDGVIVAIISTGIDYLNERFLTEDNRTRIITIWDQATKDGQPPPNAIGGTVYDKEQIQRAVDAKNSGQNPYDIVPHKDVDDYGTALAGIIGGRRLYTEDPFISVVPKCEFAIVKLKGAKKSTLQLYGIEDTKEKVYEDSDIRMAMSYLTNLQLQTKKPMIIYLPIGTNVGGHVGTSPIERDIDFYVTRKGLAIVCNTGDEGNSGTHNSGYLTSIGEKRTVEINVDEEQSNLFISMWFTRPDKVSIGIVPPTGNPIEKIPAIFSNGEDILLDIGGSKTIVQYYLSPIAGDQYVNILIRNIKGGTWKIILNGEFISNGRYDAWLFQRKLLKPQTRFVQQDPLVTLTNPSTAVNVLATAYFNSTTNVPSAEAGKGFTRDGRVQPSICTVGTNILTTDSQGKNIVVSGSSVAGAILAGAAALILQWGFVKLNDTNIYAPKLKTYLIRCTTKGEVLTYPNPVCGYGSLDFKKLFDVFNGNRNEVENLHKRDNTRDDKRSLYIKIPSEIYEREKI